MHSLSLSTNNKRATIVSRHRTAKSVHAFRCIRYRSAPIIKGRQPGIEPGPKAPQASMLTITLLSPLYYVEKENDIKMFCENVYINFLFLIYHARAKNFREDME